MRDVNFASKSLDKQDNYTQEQPGKYEAHLLVEKCQIGLNCG